MRAVRFHAAGDVRLEETAPSPAPGPGEVRLRVLAVGVCGSDALELRAGPVLVGGDRPCTLGHELAGEVVEVGPGVERLAPGMVVACGAGVSCGRCARCLEGRTNLCASYETVGFHRDGGLAEYCTVPADICVDVAPYGLTPDAAALAQPMAIAVHAARRGRIAAGETAVVVGVGGIGAFLTFVLARGGATTVVGDLSAARVEIAAALGAARTVDLGAGEDFAGALAGLERPPDVIFEVSGSAAGLRQALELAPRGARIVLVGVQKEAVPLPLRGVALDELELIGTVAHVCAADLPEALRLLSLRESWEDVAPDVLPLELAVDEGLLPIAEGRSHRIKTLFDPWTSAPRPSRTQRAVAG